MIIVCYYLVNEDEKKHEQSDSGGVVTVNFYDSFFDDKGWPDIYANYDIYVNTADGKLTTSASASATLVGYVTKKPNDNNGVLELELA